MSINPVTTTTYINSTNSNTKANSNSDFDSEALKEINSEPDKVDREEDMILYDEFKSNGLLKNNSFDYLKNGL